MGPVTVVINGRFLLNSFGGARRFAIELIERLSGLRGDIVLVTPPLPEGAEVPAVPHRVIGRSTGPVWEQIELPGWLRAHGRPLLINPATIAPIFYRHQMTVVHDIAPALRPHDFTLLFRMQWRLSARFGTLRRGQRLVTISEESRRELSDLLRVDPSRIDVVYAGADTFVAAGPRGDHDPVDRSFLVFGRHGAAKNVRAVIDAVAMLPSSAGVHVNMVGQLDPALQPYAESHEVPEDRIVWRGWLTDEELAAEYQRAAGFIWPSLHEGFGIPPLEAQSLGVPVIASDIPINREVLGDSAVYFPPTDPSALASVMSELASDSLLRERLSERGRRNAGRFTWDATAAGWDALIRRDQG